MATVIKSGWEADETRMVRRMRLMNFILIVSVIGAVLMLGITICLVLAFPNQEMCIPSELSGICHD